MVNSTYFLLLVQTQSSEGLKWLTLICFLPKMKLVEQFALSSLRISIVNEQHQYNSFNLLYLDVDCLGFDLFVVV